MPRSRGCGTHRDFRGCGSARGISGGQGISSLIGIQPKALCDAGNTCVVDDGFSLAVINGRPASRVLDFGMQYCSVGAAGDRVVGIDPDSDALTAARGKPEKGNGDWVSGTSAHIPSRGTFRRSNHDLPRGLSNQRWCCLAVDPRDPMARARECSTPVETRGSDTKPDGRALEIWVE